MAQKGPFNAGTAALGTLGVASFEITVSDDTIRGGARAVLTIGTKNLLPINQPGVIIRPTIHNPTSGAGVLPVIHPAQDVIDLDVNETEVTTFIIENANAAQARFGVDVHAENLVGVPGVHTTADLQVP